jgi:hypothetical protein
LRSASSAATRPSNTGLIGLGGLRKFSRPFFLAVRSDQRRNWFVPYWCNLGEIAIVSTNTKAKLPVYVRLRQRALGAGQEFVQFVRFNVAKLGNPAAAIDEIGAHHIPTVNLTIELRSAVDWRPVCHRKLGARPPRHLE